MAALWKVRADFHPLRTARLEKLRQRKAKVRRRFGLSETQMGGRDRVQDRPARALLFLFIFSLSFMQPPIRLMGFKATVSDFVFLALASTWALLLLLGRSQLVWHRAYWFIGAYLMAMVLSAGAADVPASGYKLLTQLYLLSVPIIVCSLVRDERTLRLAILWWLAGTTVVVIVGIISLATFAIDPGHPLLDYTRGYFGTLPPGDYPRLSLTFRNANMACNYLTVSMMILLGARHAGEIGLAPFLLLLAGTLLAALATISPGLGGVALGLGLWAWLLLRERKPRAARFILGGAAGIAVLFVGAMAVTPIVHPTAPFLIHVPQIDMTLAPSGRFIIWMDAVRNFIADPLLGRGIGADAVNLDYLTPSGDLEQHHDAHNVFLSIAVQTGIVGLAALLALIALICRLTLPLRMSGSYVGVLRLAIGLGLLNGLVYQGLGGSFEDSRHLWAAFGLLLASERLDRIALGGWNSNSHA